ncbi:MAG: thiamine diphosphokinase [Sedimentitalea sp.]
MTVSLVGGGEIGPDDLILARERSELLVAADGGASAALRHGFMPDVVVGDMDSLAAKDRARIDPARLMQIDEQDSTDFAKALGQIEAPLVLGVGFLGARLDHQLAVLNTLVARPVPPCVLIGAHEVVFHAPPQIALTLQKGDIVSLFPFAPVTGRSTGLAWPIDGLNFAPNGFVGTSNRAEGPISLAFDMPGMIVCVPRAALDTVIQSLTIAARWGA